MGSSLDIGISGLRSFRTALRTISNNIANAATPGHSRQRVDLAALPSQRFGNGFIGNGARVANIQRIESEFLTQQLRGASTEASRLNMTRRLASRMDNLLADSRGGLAPALQKFFNSIQDLSAKPGSSSARQVVLSSANSLVDRFNSIASQLSAMDNDINNNINKNIKDLNHIARSIADLNAKIVQSVNLSNNRQKPNELLDQRDKLMLRLSNIIAVKTLVQSDDSLSVFIGNGQGLVIGNSARQLAAIQDPGDRAGLRIAYKVSNTEVDISTAIKGGALAGLLEFKNQQSGAVRNELGRIASVLGGTFNRQHRLGQTLNGALGTDFFSIAPAEILAHAGNTGSAAVAATITDFKALTQSDYKLSFDGANYTLTRLDDGVETVSVKNKFIADGVQIDAGGAIAAGDEFLIRPARLGAGKLNVLITRASDIAAAAPLRSSAGVNNLGDGSISAPHITDIDHPDFKDRIEIRFNTPAATFDIVNAATEAAVAAGVTYRSGADITFNGISVKIDGTVQPGDVFKVERNNNAVSDNANARALLGLQTADTVGGASNYEKAYGGLVGRVGTLTRQATLSSQAQDSLVQDAAKAKQSVTGVNLDEEAINLTKFQQAYQAAVRVITTSDRIFESLLRVLG